jgi:hypothetical protein
MPDRSVDSVVALDLIEHMRRAEGERLLKHLVRVARQQAVVFTPLGFYRHSYRSGETDRWGMKGGRWQTHRSGWTPDDFGPEWHVVDCEDFMSWTRTRTRSPSRSAPSRRSIAGFTANNGA